MTQNEALKVAHTAISNALNSDMAMREEDEGETSDTLDALRDAVAAIDTALEGAADQPDEITEAHALDDLQRAESDCYLSDKPFTAMQAYEAVSPYLQRASNRESVQPEAGETISDAVIINALDTVIRIFHPQLAGQRVYAGEIFSKLQSWGYMFVKIQSKDNKAALQGKDGE